MPGLITCRSVSRPIIIAALGILTACASAPTPENVPISAPEPDTNLHRGHLSDTADLGDSMVLLSFSGGGTRAAALSYGVMQELRDTLIDSNGQRVRVLDEVDTISSVSGGSFTAAYYGIYRDKLFETYEEDFLRRNVQGALIGSLFNPVNWFRSASGDSSRTDRAAQYYDKHIFRGATFADMADRGLPVIDINATDISTGSRFTFGQELFDFICSDLGPYPVSKAVTASSAVPVAFPTVVLRNYADQCDVSDTPHWQILEKTQPQSFAQEELRDAFMSYRDAEARPYVHLVDGGIADNLGLRLTIDRVEGLGSRGTRLLQRGRVRSVLIILVNAEVHRDLAIDTSPKSPSGGTVLSATTSAQMNRYNQETLDSLRQNLAEYEATAKSHNSPLRFYFAEINFGRIQAKQLSEIFNSLPTSLSLPDQEVDWLIGAGRGLLRNDPEFQRFLQATNGELVPGAITQEQICDLSPTGDCPAMNSRP